MAQKYYAILTPFGLNAVAEALNGGDTIKLSFMAVGDGSGAEYEPEEGQTDIKNQKHELALMSVYKDEFNPGWVVCDAYLPEDVGGFWVREAAIRDENHNTIAIASLPSSYKSTLTDGSPSSMLVRLIFQVSNTDSVEFKLDSSMVLVSREEFERHVLAADTEFTAINARTQYATEAVAGIVMKATPAEAAAGIDNEKYLTSSGVNAAISQFGLWGNPIYIDGAGITDLKTLTGTVYHVTESAPDRPPSNGRGIMLNFNAPRKTQLWLDVATYRIFIRTQMWWTLDEWTDWLQVGSELASVYDGYAGVDNTKTMTSVTVRAAMAQFGLWPTRWMVSADLNTLHAAGNYFVDREGSGLNYPPGIWAGLGLVNVYSDNDSIRFFQIYTQCETGEQWQRFYPFTEWKRLDTWNGKTQWIGAESALPATKDANTIYFAY